MYPHGGKTPGFFWCQWCEATNQRVRISIQNINEKRAAPKPTFFRVFVNGKITWFVGGLKPLFFHGFWGAHGFLRSKRSFIQVPFTYKRPY